MPSENLAQARDKATATLYGLAMGDALGMPSQTLTADEIRQRYGTIDRFVAPFKGHPVAAGLGAGQVTDDTEQTLLLAKRIIHSPDHFDPQGWAQDLLDWESGVRGRGLLDLLGPSSKAALEEIRRGIEPAEAAKVGSTNGAAMRIAPLGIAIPFECLDELVDAVERTCRVTHNTGEAIAGAAAVAGYISSRISGLNDKVALTAALSAADCGQSRGHQAGVSDMPERIMRAVELAATGIAVEEFAKIIGTSVATHESIPAAFGLMRLAAGDVWKAGCLAANIGDDTDTIGAISCAMCGAGGGTRSLPKAMVAALDSANTLDISPIADNLFALRQQALARLAARAT